MRHRTSIRQAVACTFIILCTSTVLGQILTGKAELMRGADMMNLHNLGRAVLLYTSSNDMYLPLGSGQDATGRWAWNLYHYVPADWPSGPGQDGNYQRRVEVSPTYWANTVAPYNAAHARCDSPGLRPAQVSASRAENGNGLKLTLNSYTYVGTLSSYGFFAIAHPATMPMLWQGEGNRNIVGASHSNPNLICDAANAPCVYRPYSTGCLASQNGAQSTMMVTTGSMWVYDKTATWLTVDTAASHRPLGAKVQPENTDYAVDPYTGYDANGFGGYQWWDGCHSWLFRPDKS